MLSFFVPEEQDLHTDAIYSNEGFDRFYIIGMLENYTTQFAGIDYFHYLARESVNHSDRSEERLFTFSAVLWPTPRMDLASA